MEADTIKQAEMKDKIQKEYLRRTRKLLETQLLSRNFIKGINIWAVPLLKYSVLFLKWIRDELRQKGQGTRKLMTMQRHYIPEMTLTDYMYQEKREEEDLSASKTALTHQYNDLKTI